MALIGALSIPCVGKIMVLIPCIFFVAAKKNESAIMKNKTEPLFGKKVSRGALEK
jgi:hypothetical protein